MSQILEEHQLSYLNNQERLSIYQEILNGCTHIYSKGKLNTDRMKTVLDKLIILAEKDPYFLAHFTSYAMTKLQSKDLKILSVFANSLNDADGTPFIVGEGENGKPIYGSIKKPNLRIVSQAAVQTSDFDAKLVERLIEIANIKQPLGNKYAEGTHFSGSLKTAIKKYVRYREMNPKALEGVKKSGMAQRFKNIYRMLHIAPSEEAAQILGWNQKKGGKVTKKNFFNFSDLSDIEVAEKIRAEKLPPLGVLGALNKKISPVIALAVLEQCSGDQAVILRELFDSQGLLKHEEVFGLFTEKINEAKTALDRVERINTKVDEDVQKTLKKARSSVRKKQVGNIGKIFLHLDCSVSMDNAIGVAKEKGSVIAECVSNPEENFHWGIFGNRGISLNKPDSFEKDGFMAALYGVRADMGSTDCIACYTKARELGCDIDVYITDGQHNQGSIKHRIDQYTNKGYAKPKVAVIVQVGRYMPYLKIGLEGAGIPVAEIKESVLNESALITQVVNQALRGAVAVIDDIMDTPLLKLPKWWGSVKV